jgi:hypothetical protein
VASLPKLSYKLPHETRTSEARLAIALPRKGARLGPSTQSKLPPSRPAPPKRGLARPGDKGLDIREAWVDGHP